MFSSKSVGTYNLVGDCTVLFQCKSASSVNVRRESLVMCSGKSSEEGEDFTGIEKLTWHEAGRKAETGKLRTWWPFFEDDPSAQQYIVEAKIPVY